MRKIFLLFFTTTALFIIGCQNKTEVKKEDHSAHSNQNATVKETGKFTAELKTNPAEIKAGEQTDLSFTIKNPKDETVESVKIVHEKPLHLLIVSEDLDEFYHEHPEQQSDKSFKVPFTFKIGGKYKLYADFTPNDGNQVVQTFDLTVAGNERAKVELKPDEKLEKTVDELSVTMKPSEDLMAGKSLTLDFYVYDVKTKKLVTDLQNYLGELAHFVVISQDLKEFVHAHPMSKESGHSHGQTEKEDLRLSATVSAHLAFPKAGLYKVFAQFQRGGKIITVPFVLNVKGDKNVNQHANSTDIPKDAYRITASKEGFSPGEIRITKNSYKQLAFVRVDAQNCADEVVFKSLNITKKLPLGEVVLVDLPKDFTGELSFACGMNMYQGKVVVE